MTCKTVFVQGARIHVESFRCSSALCVVAILAGVSVLSQPTTAALIEKEGDYSHELSAASITNPVQASLIQTAQFAALPGNARHGQLSQTPKLLLELGTDAHQASTTTDKELAALAAELAADADLAADTEDVQVSVNVSTQQPKGEDTFPPLDSRVEVPLGVYGVGPHTVGTVVGLIGNDSVMVQFGEIGIRYVEAKDLKTVEVPPAGSFKQSSSSEAKVQALVAKTKPVVIDEVGKSNALMVEKHGLMGAVNSAIKEFVNDAIKDSSTSSHEDIRTSTLLAKHSADATGYPDLQSIDESIEKIDLTKKPTGKDAIRRKHSVQTKPWDSGVMSTDQHTSKGQSEPLVYQDHKDLDNFLIVWLRQTSWSLPQLILYVFVIALLIFSIMYGSLHVPGLSGPGTHTAAEQMRLQISKQRKEAGLKPGAIEREAKLPESGVINPHRRHESYSEEEKNIEEMFQCASDLTNPILGPFFSSLINEDRLQLYGLLKQGTVGDIIGTCPIPADKVGHSKYDAWSVHKGMSKLEAKKDYVSFLDSKATGWQDGIRK